MGTAPASTRSPGKLRQSPRVGELLLAPGNPGTASLAENIGVAPSDLDAITATARDRSIGLVVVGPEGPLADGLTDRLMQDGVAVFGPTRSGARIESSKRFAKGLMHDAAIPTAAAVSFDNYQNAVDYVRAASYPPVIKADGLAGGKGVTVAGDTAKALSALRDAMLDGAFGAAGRSVVIEERLYGREVSAHAFSDGHRTLALPYACDHKAVGDGGIGPNTGGMGAYSPPDFIDAELDRVIQKDIVQAAVEALNASGAVYRGLLYPWGLWKSRTRAQG